MPTITIVRPNGSMLAFDNVSDYTDGRSITVTDHPTEQDSQVSDHAQPQPRTLTFNGLVTESPDRRTDTTGGPARTLAAEDFLTACEKERVTIVTARRTYTDMVCTRHDTPITGRRGIRFACAFRQVRVATATVITLPGLAGSSTVDVGEQATTDAAQLETEVQASLSIAQALTATATAGSATSTPKLDADRSAALEVSDWLGLGL